MGKPTLEDKQTKEALKLREISPFYERDQYIKNLRIMDEQEFISRGKWFNLPKGIDGELLERMLYYRGEVAMFYIPELNEFRILPYNLNGTIDEYGRYTGIVPLPFNGKSTMTKEEKDKMRPYIPGMIKKPVYEVFLPDELTLEIFDDSAVLLTDYCKQMSQTVLPRVELSDIYIQHEADYLCYLHTAMMNKTGINGMKVDSDDEQVNVATASMSANAAALRGEKWIAIKGGIEFQELTKGSTSPTEEFLIALQSLENQRLSTMGLENGGIFQKKAHELQSEANMIAGYSNAVLDDSVRTRQRFCMIANSIWGTGIWYEPSETAMNGDMDMDGQMGNEEPVNEQEANSNDSSNDEQ